VQLDITPDTSDLRYQNTVENKPFAAKLNNGLDFKFDVKVPPKMSPEIDEEHDKLVLDGELSLLNDSWGEFSVRMFEECKKCIVSSLKIGKNMILLGK